jgi:hypothetical protein
MMPLLVLVLVLLFRSSSHFHHLPPLAASALEATFTPNPNDSIENGGTGSGPLPASAAQRKQLLELDVVIANSDDPNSTLEHVAKQNGMTSQDLASVLDRNRSDLRESGQLESMLDEANAAALAARQGGGGGGPQGDMIASTLPRRILGLVLSILAALTRTASARISRHPGRSTALAAVLAVALLASHNAPTNGIVISSGSFPPFFSRGHTTFLEPPTDYLERWYCGNVAEENSRGGVGWKSSLPGPTSGGKKKKRTSSSRSSASSVGGVGMTRYLDIDDDGANTRPGGTEGEVTVQTRRSGVDGFRLITTARTTICDEEGDGGLIQDDGDDDEGELLRLEEAECMRQSTRSIIEERKFSELVRGDDSSPSLKFRSLPLDGNDDDDDVVVEGAVMAMKLLGNFGRYGVQPFRISYETGDDDDDDADEADCAVAYHTLTGGHFDGELRFSVEEIMKDGGGVIVVSVTLAIPDGGRAPPKRLAEAMVSSFAQSIARSIRMRTEQTLARRRQSRGYRERASGRASVKRHLRYEQERLQEEMAAERKRKWKRNNPDAGHYRPSGHRLKSPNNC